MQGLQPGLLFRFESLIASDLTTVTNMLAELYQEQTSSPVTSRAHLGYSAVTGVTGYDP